MVRHPGQHGCHAGGDEDQQIEHAVQSTLPFRLSGLLSNSDARLSMAVFQHGNQQRVVSITEQLPGTQASVVRIFPDRVVIRHNGRYEAFISNESLYSGTFMQMIFSQCRRSARSMLLLLAGFLLSLSAHAQGYQANFKNTDIDEFITTVSKALNKPSSLSRR